MQLPAYSIAQNISTETEEVGIGYAHPRREYNTNSTDAVVFLIAFGNMVLSKVIIITLVTTYYDSAVDLMRWKISPVYYFFWGCHCTTFWVFIVGNSFYIAWTQENKAILSVPGLSALIDFLAAIAMLCAVIMKWWPSTRVTDLLPVPLTACFRTCFESNKPLQYFLNFVAFFFTFFFISSLLRIFPNLLISYYAFPSRTLIHIGFFQVSFVCLVVAFGGLIFLLEKCAWLVHIKKHGKIPEELNSVALIRQYIDINEGESRSPSVSESSQEEPHVGSIQESHNECGTLKSSHGNDEMPASPDTSGGASIAVGINQQPKLQLNSTLTESDSQYQNIEYLNEATLKNPIRTFSSMSFQILTALLLLVALFLLIIVIGIIVSANTVDKDSVQAILTLLPTVVVDIVIVLTRKKFFNNRVALEYRLARVVEDTPEDDAKDDRKLESNNETTPLLRKNRTYNR